MVVGLGNGRSVTAEALAACTVGFKNCAIGFRLLAFYPGKKRRAEVEADIGIVIDDALDASLIVENARSRVRRVTFGVNALVPVVKGIGGILHLDGLEPRVLTRGLVKVRVDTDVVPDRDRSPVRGESLLLL